MDHQHTDSTDRLLRELFKRNAPYVNESALRERIDERLPRGRGGRRRRRAWPVRTVAVACASIVLAGGAAFGAYEVVTYLHGQGPSLVITDQTVPGGGKTPSAGNAAGTSAIAGLVPVMGTATLEQVKSEGTAVSSGDVTRLKGRVLVYRLDMSQSGISGTFEITIDLQRRAQGGDIWASWVLSNDQGTWECTSWVGTLSADGLEQFGYGGAFGTGAYEGLTLYLQWHSTQEPGSTALAAESGTVTGWIESAE
jgi:hypothetical protein